ncbi:hypothetical protein V5O48_010463 [Marasmius crinis-equi]|uniref:Uncharacterized protein n=1 Tax=Marasmius crinis-equi TaxID=585013 RepID=A0ABR3F8W4_9AGAR
MPPTTRLRAKSMSGNSNAQTQIDDPARSVAPENLNQRSNTMKQHNQVSEKTEKRVAERSAKKVAGHTKAPSKPTEIQTAPSNVKGIAISTPASVKEKLLNASVVSAIIRDDIDPKSTEDLIHSHRKQIVVLEKRAEFAEQKSHELLEDRIIRELQYELEQGKKQLDVALYMEEAFRKALYGQGYDSTRTLVKNDSTRKRAALEVRPVPTFLSDNLLNALQDSADACNDPDVDMEETSPTSPDARETDEVNVDVDEARDKTTAKEPAREMQKAKQAKRQKMTVAEADKLLQGNLKVTEGWYQRISIGKKSADDIPLIVCTVIGRDRESLVVGPEGSSFDLGVTQGIISFCRKELGLQMTSRDVKKQMDIPNDFVSCVYWIALSNRSNPDIESFLATLPPRLNINIPCMIRLSDTCGLEIAIPSTEKPDGVPVQFEDVPEALGEEEIESGVQEALSGVKQLSRFQFDSRLNRVRAYLEWDKDIEFLEEHRVLMDGERLSVRLGEEDVPVDLVRADLCPFCSYECVSDGVEPQFAEECNTLSALDVFEPFVFKTTGPVRRSASRLALALTRSQVRVAPERPNLKLRKKPQP